MSASASAGVVVDGLRTSGATLTGRLPAVHRLGPAFTLIELLVVIAVIGILAGLIVGGLPAITSKKISATMHTELVQLQGAIQNYKLKKGYYPPDNSNNPAINPLYYELAGSTFNASRSEYVTLLNDPPINGGKLMAAFGVSGLANAITGAERDVENFLPPLRPSQISTQLVAGVKLLAAPYPRNGVNPWHYNSSHPQHNLDSFDLWAEFVDGTKTNVYGNWRE